MSSESSVLLVHGTEEYSFDKMERNAHAMFSAVPAMQMFGTVPYMVVGTRAGKPGAGGACESRVLKRARGCRFCLSEDTFRAVDPGRPMELFVMNFSKSMTALVFLFPKVYE